MEDSKFARGAQVHCLGKPKVSLGRVLFVLAAVGGGLAAGPGKAATSADVVYHGGGQRVQVKVVDVAARQPVVRGASLATPRPLAVAERDTGGEMARHLLDMLGDGGADQAAPAPAMSSEREIPIERVVPQRRADPPPRVEAGPSLAGELDAAPSAPPRAQVAPAAPAKVSPVPAAKRDFDPTYVSALQTRAPSSVVPESGHVFKQLDAEIDEEGKVVYGVAERPGELSPAESFNEPTHLGAPKTPPPPSRFGIDYTWTPNLHVGVNDRRDAQILEGGFTTHAGAGKQTYLPRIPDPSDAFMNVAVLAVMQNANMEYAPAAKAIEDLLSKAKECVDHFGLDHACSASGYGVTFDYGQATFAIRLLDKGSDAGRKGAGVVVARETQQGMYPGPAFKRVAVADWPEGPSP